MSDLCADASHAPSHVPFRRKDDCARCLLAARDAELRDVRSELARVEEAFARSRREFVDALASAKYERLRLEADLRFGSVVVDEQMWTETRDAALRVPVLEAELEEARREAHVAAERLVWWQEEHEKRRGECLAAQMVEKAAQDRAEAAEAARRELAKLPPDVSIEALLDANLDLQDQLTAERQSAERARAVVRQMADVLRRAREMDEQWHRRQIIDEGIAAAATLLGEGDR